MWEATITNVSELDSSGMFEVTFSVSFGGVVKYENLVRRGNDKSLIQDEIRETLREFKRKTAELDKFTVGDKVSI